MKTRKWTRDLELKAKLFTQNSCSSTLEAQGNPNSAQNSTLLQTFLGSDVMRAN